VDGSAREGRGAAEVEPGERGRVGRELRQRAEDDLAQPVASTTDVAADQVRVACLQVGRAEHVAGEDAVAEAGREALHLRLHALGHDRRRGRPVDAVLRAVRVRPRGVLAGRRARRVGDALLAEQQERGVGEAVVSLFDGGHELLLGSSHVDGPGAVDVRVLPGDRAVERPVDLDRRRALDVGAQRLAVPRGQLFGHPHQRARHDVGDHGARAELLVGGRDAAHAPARRQHSLHPRAGADLAAEAVQVGDECVGESLGTAARTRPADGVAEQVQVEGRDRGAGAVGRRVAVHRGAVEPGARAAVVEQPPPEVHGGRRQQPGELGEPQRAGSREQAQRAFDRREAGQHRRPDGAEVLDERARERRPGRAVGAEARGGRVEVAVEHDRLAPGQRMPIAGRRMDPLEPVVCQRHAREHGRGRRRRVDGGERVVVKARQRQLLGPHGPAGAVGGLEHEHLAAGLGEPDRGGEAVRPGADHDRVAHAASCFASWCSMLNASSPPWPQNACWASLPASL
jgi:hypothetical protein